MCSSDLFPSHDKEVGGKFRFECFDKDGNLKWVSESKNTVTNEGLLYLLDQVFGAAAKVAQWYVGLYTATVGAHADLTGADIGGANLTEFTGYSGTRKTFDGARIGYTWANSGSQAQFPITSNATIKGAFLASDDAGTADYLLCIDGFDAGDRAVAPSDTLKVSYVFSVQTL